MRHATTRRTAASRLATPPALHPPRLCPRRIPARDLPSAAPVQRLPLISASYVRALRTPPPMDRAEYIARVARHASPLRLYFFASFAALGIYSPFFPRWLVARGVEGVAMGAIVATLPAMGVIGPPVVGLLADSL